MKGNSSQQKFAAKLQTLHKKARANGVDDRHFEHMLEITSKSLSGSGEGYFWRKAVLFGVLIACISFGYIVFASMDPRCLVSNNLMVLELARPAVSCEVCKDLDSVPTVDGDKLDRKLFMEKYAYSGIPLLVKGGARNWTALDTFNFDYLRDLFQQTDGALEAVERDCQFFPYKTEFMSMEEVFDMPRARSQFKEGEKLWYVGWSNCHPDVARQLRKHYGKPAFLPEDSETSNLDWLFMGGFGGGADVHIDYVQRPSWQAMIAGKKSWKIVPSPECDSICRTLNATMEKGDIIVVDTNMWYHSTYIHPGEMSITIGSEYD